MAQGRWSQDKNSIKEATVSKFLSSQWQLVRQSFQRPYEERDKSGGEHDDQSLRKIDQQKRQDTVRRCNWLTVDE